MDFLNLLSVKKVRLVNTTVIHLLIFHLIFCKLFHEACVSLGEKSIKNMPLQLGFSLEFCDFSVFSLNLKLSSPRNSYPKVEHLSSKSLPKANLPSDMSGRFRGLKQKCP